MLAGRDTLLEIAVRYGYGSGEAFARAFRAMHGIGPGEARRTGAALSSQSRMAFRLTVEGSSSMRYRLVDKAAFTVVGLRARVPLVHAGPNRAIMDFVRGIDPRTLERVEKLSDQEPHGIVAVCDDLDPSRAEGTDLDYHHGVVTSAAAPEGTTALSVPAGDLGGLHRLRARAAGHPGTVAGRVHRVVPVEPVPHPHRPRDPAHPPVAGEDRGRRRTVAPGGARAGRSAFVAREHRRPRMTVRR